MSPFTFIGFLIQQAAMVLAGVFLLLFPGTPDQTSITLYDRNGEILWDTSRPEIKNIHQVSPFFLETLIAEEDEKFYAHTGVNYPRIVSALYNNAKQNRVTSGASTITMQLAGKSYLKDQPHNILYKTKQILLAHIIESAYTKNTILEQYINHAAFFGANTVGLASATREYFHKSPHEINQAESIALVAMLPNPSLYNIRTNPKNWQTRYEQIVDRLQKQEKITESQAQDLKNNPPIPKSASKKSIKAPHFVDYVQQQIKEQHPNLKNKPHLNIHTTLDLALYEKAAKLAEKQIQKHKEININNAAIVVLDKNNEIRVMVGNVEFFENQNDNQVNMATASRQVGSTLKPFLYATAIEMGYSPAQGINDIRKGHQTSQGMYSPRNFTIKEQYGLVHYREALANSYNLSAINLLAEIGVTEFATTLKKLDIYPASWHPEGDDYSIGLGSQPSSLLHLTNAYSTLRDLGGHTPYHAITYITDQNNKRLFTQTEKQSQQVLNPTTAEWVTHALSDDEIRWKNFSRGNALELPFPVASKSGTSQLFRDNYIIGYTPHFSIGVWVGNTKGEPLHTGSGIAASGPIWHTLAMNLSQKEGNRPFPTTGQRTPKEICQKPDQKICSHTITEYLTKEEIEKLPQITISEPEIQITFPHDGDILHAHTQLIIQAKTKIPNTPLTYQINNQKASPIQSNLPPGYHELKACSKKSCSTPITIFVEQ